MTATIKEAAGDGATPPPPVAFVTGAARGLGREIAYALASAGHALYLIDILADRLDATAADLRAAGASVEARVADVSVRAQCVDAVADCLTRCGSLGVLVNCAAVLRMEPVETVSGEDWDRIVGVNLSGPFHLTQAALPHIVAARGNIVNVASSNGLLGTPYTGPYAATKAALISLTKTLAMEYVDRPIRVNAVCPGPMDTEIARASPPHPDVERAKIARYSGQRGLADAADVAKVVAFLASDAAASVHGAVWTADLGASAG